MKIVVNENEKGFLFKNGRFVKLLDAGKYHIFGNNAVEKVLTKEMVHSEKCTLEQLLKNEDVSAQTDVVEVKDEQIAIHFVNGRFLSVLRRGKYAFWNTDDKHEFQIVDISTPYVADDVPKYIFGKIPQMTEYIKVQVEQYQKGRLYFDKKFVKLLEPGTYYFWRMGVNVEVTFVDTRLMRMDIVGQEILTQDKVSVRINFICNYRITDYMKIVTEIDDYQQQIHISAQLALREFVGRYRIDEILENKDRLAQYMLERLKEKEKTLFVEITDAGVKDIILPGEIRDIMNTVLVAEKRAQANVITRREEVASTRSLLNTAKLMDENKTLYKLKELEYMERICENVGNINLNGNVDVLTQLAAVLRPCETQ